VTRRRRRVAPIIALASVCVGLGWTAMASPSHPSDDRAPGHLEISSIDLTTGTQDSIFSALGMLPGDEVTAAVTVVNSSRQPMTYAMSRGATLAGGAALSAALTLTIRTVGSSCADFDGTVLFDGPLDEAGFGRESDGRPLAAATAEILCFRAALPRDASNALQGTATTIALYFGATNQVAVR
jgi:hypothetical protein